MTKIMGNSVATASQMATYLLSKNSNPKFSRKISAVDFCQLYLDIAAREGVRGDIAFAQMLKETGNMKFNGDVSYRQNNFAGIGATGGVPGNTFPSIEIGILAHVQHLKSYATTASLNEANVDPRRTNWFMKVKGGTSPHVETLGGSWAVPGYSTSKYKSLAAANAAKDSYGYQIMTILNSILKIENNDKKEENDMKYTNSSLVSYIKISPNKTSPRNHEIDTITIHCMAGNLSVERCGDVFAKRTRSASSNYGIGSDGRIAMYVEESDRSWCTSNKVNDHRAITIEVANDGGAPDWHVSDKAMASLIKLCADICKRNNIQKLVWSTNKQDRIKHLNGCNMTVHRDYAAKACPGNYLYNKHSYIAYEVNKLLGVNIPTPSVVPTTAPVNLKATATIAGVQRYLNENYLDVAVKLTGKRLDTDGSFGNKSKLVLIGAIQTELNKLGAGIVVDGKFGNASAVAWNSKVSVLKKGSTGIFVTLWQCLLVCMKYNPNGIDGKFGNGCVKASNQILGNFRLAKDSSVSGNDVNRIL